MEGVLMVFRFREFLKNVDGGDGNKKEGAKH